MNVEEKKFGDFAKQILNGYLYKEGFKKALCEFFKNKENHQFLHDTSHRLECRLYILIVIHERVPLKIFDELNDKNNRTQGVFNAFVILYKLQLISDENFRTYVKRHFQVDPDYENISRRAKFSFQSYKLEELKYKNDAKWKEGRKVPHLQKEMSDIYESINIDSPSYYRVMKILSKRADQHKKICINHDMFIDYSNKYLDRYCNFMRKKGISFNFSTYKFSENCDRRKEIFELVKKQREEKITEKIKVNSKKIIDQFEDGEMFTNVLRTLDRLNIDFIITSEWDTCSVYNFMCDIGLENMVDRIYTLDMYDEEISFNAADYDLSFGLKEEEGSLLKNDLLIYIEFMKDTKLISKKSHEGTLKRVKK